MTKGKIERSKILDRNGLIVNSFEIRSCVCDKGFSELYELIDAVQWDWRSELVHEQIASASTSDKSLSVIEWHRIASWQCLLGNSKPLFWRQRPADLCAIVIMALTSWRHRALRTTMTTSRASDHKPRHSVAENLANQLMLEREFEWDDPFNPFNAI